MSKTRRIIDIPIERICMFYILFIDIVNNGSINDHDPTGTYQKGNRSIFQ